MSQEDYGVRSNAYLLRARCRLDENTSDALFYAAFELRCGVEARMREYLEDQEHVSRKKREGWQIAALAGTLEQTFSLGELGARYTFYRDSSLIGTLEYRPVLPVTRAAAERLGDYLHAQRAYRNPDDPWWVQLRAFLESTYRGLEWSVSGELLGPPLRDPQGRIAIHAVVDADGPFSAFAAGQPIRVDIEYFKPELT